MEIDAQRDAYLFLHGREDVRERAMAALGPAGFDPARVRVASPDKVGAAGDYMAMLWPPQDPDHIRIQRITGVKDADPGGMTGLWKGVSKDDVGTVRL